MNTDVLIVGAGPTGLMLANQLGRRGIKTMIVDRHAGPAAQTRALGVHARSLEIYAKLDLADKAIQLGKPATGANIWANGVHKGRVPLGDAGKELTAYPFILVLGQDDNERIMGEKLREWDIAIQWNTELTAIKQHPDRVEATVKESNGAVRTVTAQWIAGCDGAHSAVRELNGIGFPGAPYEHVFYVADVEMTGDMIADEVNVFLWKSGFHLFFPMRGRDHWRIVGILPAELQGKDGVTFEDVIPSIRKESSRLYFANCTWFSTYRIHHRSAAQFRAGRCFVLGDAAHIHSPVGAQGMNTGLQDAYNLAWKLAMVVQGQAGEGLLDSYAEERQPVAKQLLNTTDRAFRLVVSDSPLAGLLRTQVLARIAAFAMSRHRIQRSAFRTVSQIGIHYRDGSLSRSLQPLAKEAPRAGDRFPWMKLKLQSEGKAEDLFRALDDTRFNLLLFGWTESPPSSNDEKLLRSWTIPDSAQNAAECRRASVPLPAFYLLRPDGYIGLCGTSLSDDALGEYFESLCRPNR